MNLKSNQKHNSNVDGENDAVFNFIKKSKCFQMKNGQYNVRGHYSRDLSAALEAAEISMRILCRQKGAYLEISKKNYETLPVGEKIFIDQFNKNLRLMELQLDKDGNFQNVENSVYIK